MSPATASGAAAASATEAPPWFLAQMIERRVELARTVTDQIVESESAYRAGTLGNELLVIVESNLNALLMEMGGGPETLAPARLAGRTKAEVGIPMPSLLHAYRLAGLAILNEIGELTRGSGEADAVIDVASALWEVLDRYSTAAVEAYREIIDEQERRGAQSRRVHMLALLSGTAPDPKGSLRVLGLPEAGWYSVVTAGLGSAGDDPEPACGEGRKLATIVWAQDAGVHIGIVGALSRRGVEAALAEIAKYPTTPTGASRAFERASEMLFAADEARSAMRCLPPGARELSVYGDRPLALAITAGPDTARELVSSVLGGILALGEASARPLLDTLDAWVASGGSTPATAALLHCHRNTVLYRVQRITELTGRKLSDPTQSAELVAAAAALHLLGDAALAQLHADVRR